MITGVSLFVFGCAVSLFSYFEYAIGTLTRMGPGMFPTALGLILSALGALIAVPAWFRAGEVPKIALRPLIVILVSLSIFAFMLQPFGIVPAVVVLTLGAILADDQVGIRGAVALAAGMAVTTVILFQQLLGVPFQAFRWPL
ncbi:tripartite tricarboxylate transporter TctB family protein [Faunimonas sp. B44]